MPANVRPLAPTAASGNGVHPPSGTNANQPLRLLSDPGVALSAPLGEALISSGPPVVERSTNDEPLCTGATIAHSLSSPGALAREIAPPLRPISPALRSYSRYVPSPVGFR